MVVNVMLLIALSQPDIDAAGSLKTLPSLKVTEPKVKYRVLPCNVSIAVRFRVKGVLLSVSRVCCCQCQGQDEWVSWNRLGLTLEICLHT